MSLAQHYAHGGRLERSSQESWLSWLATVQGRRPEERMEDEDEVLYELDENAMSQLPHHLQANMREMQMERYSRLSQQDPNFEIRAHPHRMYGTRGYNTNQHSSFLPFTEQENLHIGSESGDRLLRTVTRSSSLPQRSQRPRRERPAIIFGNTWIPSSSNYQHDDYSMEDIDPSVAPHQYRAPVGSSRSTVMMQSYPGNDRPMDHDCFEVRGRTKRGYRRSQDKPSGSSFLKRASRLVSHIQGRVRRGFYTMRKFLKKEK